jgi:hypothetical protein
MHPVHADDCPEGTRRLPQSARELSERFPRL